MPNTPHDAERLLELDAKVELIVCGQEGRAVCVYLNDYRIAGGKPWGGGTTMHRWTTSLREIVAAFPELSASAPAQRSSRNDP